MPSSRQFKAIGLITLLVVLVLYYVTNGERLTHDSEFYKKTVAAIEHKKTTAEKEATYAKERETQERIQRLQKEHDAATATASLSTSESTEAAAVGPRPGQQKPMVDDAVTGEKSVAGRKKMSNGKIVDERPASDKDDGVAKVGNIAVKTAGVSNGESEHKETQEDHEVETELNDILKKGPIIVFSKSYCPFSKKAKHILLELYSITPAPYVVELDQHKLGSGLQDALLRSTGRRTVPNVLINAKSIGGGDDIQHLHDSGKLIETVQAMGGKRIMSISKNPVKHEARAEVKFKA